MYYITLALFMFILPLLSVLAELIAFRSTTGVIALIGKWWVFWSVRLFTAGLRQATNPRFTAAEIFHFKTSEPLVVIRELGFANIALGLTGLLAIVNSAWIAPAAVAGGAFYGLVGILHVGKKDRNRVETIAMWTDLWMAAVLLVYLVLTVVRPM